MLWRRNVQPDNILQLFGKPGIAGNLERLDQMGLESIGLPYLTTPRLFKPVFDLSVRFRTDLYSEKRKINKGRRDACLIDGKKRNGTLLPGR